MSLFAILANTGLLIVLFLLVNRTRGLVPSARRKQIALLVFGLVFLASLGYGLFLSLFGQ